MRFRKLYVNINSQCNCQCINCILRKESRIKESLLGIEDIQQTLMKIDKLKSKYLNIFEISGGEPTLHNDLLGILSIVKSAKNEGKIHKIALLTNAMKLSDNAYCEKVSEYIDDAIVTLYSCYPDEHDWFTGVPGSFESKIQGIDNMIKNGVNVHIKILIIKPSYVNLKEMMSYIYSKWEDKVHIALNGTHFTGDAKDNHEDLSIQLSDAKVYIEDALDFLLDNKIRFSVFLPLCILDPKYWKNSPVRYKELIDNSFSISPTYGFGKATRLLDEFINKNPICQNCVLVERCNWPWKQYCNIYGSGEILYYRDKLGLKIQGGE